MEGEGSRRENRDPREEERRGIKKTNGSSGSFKSREEFKRTIEEFKGETEVGEGGGSWENWKKQEKGEVGRKKTSLRTISALKNFRSERKVIFHFRKFYNIEREKRERPSL